MGEYIIYYREKLLVGFMMEASWQPVKSAIAYAKCKICELPYDGAAGVISR